MDEIKRLGEYNSVGGSSTHILFNFTGYGALYMGSLISISYSTFRDKTPVYSLGNTNIDGFALGKRYIAGSLVKTFFMNDDLKQFLTKLKNDIGSNESIDSLYALTGDSFKTYHHLLIDDIVPFDIIIVLCTEYGDWSVSEVVYGATFINTGQVYSIGDIITETTMSFVANDVRMTHDRIGSQMTSLITPSTAQKASTLKKEKFGNTAAADYGIQSDVVVGSYADVLAAVEQELLPRSALSDWENGAAKGKIPTRFVNGNPVSYLDNTQSEQPVTKITTSTNQDKEYYSPIDIPVSNLVLGNLHNGVGSIHDADTLKFNIVRQDGTKESESFRLMGMDAPEVDEKGISQPHGKKSLDYMQNYITSGQWDQDVENGAVRIAGQDKYGRTLLFNANYTENAVMNGIAVAEVALSSQSGLTKEELKVLSDAETYARNNKLGIWASEAPMVYPSEWRRWSEDKRKEYVERYGE